MLIQPCLRLLTAARCGQVLEESRHAGRVGRRSRLEAWTACLGMMPPLYGHLKADTVQLIRGTIVSLWSLGKKTDRRDTK